MSETLRGLHLHLEPTSGIAGDMAVAALVDAGVPARVVTDAVARLDVRGLRVGFERRQRGAYVGRGFVVRWPEAGKKRRRAAGRPNDDHDHDHDHDHPHSHDHDHQTDDHHHDAAVGREHRDYGEIRRLIKRADLDADVAALAGDMFARIAAVEAALHGSPVDRVTFHEVGAYDSIADIVGVAAAIAWLRPASIGSLPPVVGTGQVRTAHGLVAVPAPATAALLRGSPIVPEGAGELTTPTGAVILAAVVDSFGPPPPMRLRAVGYGAGTRELADRPNVLRVMLGEPLGQADAPAAPALALLEANLDDMNPQLLSPLYDALLAAGAVDVWSASILMKKGRPATTVSALVTPGARAAVQRAFFLNSTTLGLRARPVDRVTLARSFVTAQTPYGAVRIKVAGLNGEVIGAHPEFEDCRRLAAKAKVPVRAVMAAASAEAERWLRAGARPTGRPRRGPGPA